MRMLLIEDRPTGSTTMIATLSRFGAVKAAQTIDDANRVMASGWNPDVVIADINLGDGRKWHESFADVVALARDKPIAAQAAYIYRELAEEFGQRFGHNAELFAKTPAGNRALIEWMQQFREDESGRMVQTMDRGSKQSHSDIRAEIIAYAEHIGVPAPADQWLRDLVRCVVKWQSRGEKALDRTWGTLLVLMVCGIAGWLVMAFSKWQPAAW